SGLAELRLSRTERRRRPTFNWHTEPAFRAQSSASACVAIWHARGACLVTFGGDPIGPSGVFSLAAPDANYEILDAAGFTDIRVEEIPCPGLPSDDFEHYWAIQSTVAGPPCDPRAVAPGRRGGGHQGGARADTSPHSEQETP